MLWDHLTQLPCMATPAFYTSTALCILSSSHSVLEWSVLLKLRAKSSMMLRILWPSPVRNQWHSLYYHPGFGPNVAKTESNKQHQSRKPSRQTCTYRHRDTQTHTATHADAHTFPPTHTHKNTHTITYAHIQCTFKRARHRRIHVLGK